MKIRLYGPVIGNGSFARVLQGTEHALKTLKMHAGTVPIDAYDEEDVYPGFDAEIGLLIGPINLCSVMRQLGTHKQRLLMLAPNSSWLPQSLFSPQIADMLTGFLTPSEWGAGVIRSYTSLPVEVLRHGVSPAFVVDPALRAQALQSFRDGKFLVGHFASTTMQRKGTDVLVEAWADFLRIYPDVEGVLTLVVDAPEGYYAGAIARAAAGSERIDRSFQVLSRLDLDEMQQASLYGRFHAVVQPSRGEGFGLVPLEARACGVPVAQTSCTGHDEHAYERSPGARLIAPGVQLIESGDLDFIDDGPGAKCPTVSAPAVQRALGQLYEEWSHFHEEALAGASDVQTQWSWERGITHWLNKKRRNV